MFRWNTVAIYGVGLIGGSIGMALRERGLAREVVGIGRNADRLRTAVELGALSGFSVGGEEWSAAELVVVCTPVKLVADHCAAVAERCGPETLLTDVGSTKQRLTADIERRIPEANFVGSHPLAGSDRSGVEFADGALFVDRNVVLTPTDRTAPRSVESVTEFWKSLGAKVSIMTPADHDRALARTSHLPHVLASALAAETPKELLSLTAGGWRDSTRIAGADIELWEQILDDNSDNVAAAIRQLRVRLGQFETALVTHDQESIVRLLQEGKQHRDALGS